MITVIDLGMGNLESVANAFRRIGKDVKIAQSPEQASDARVIVLPGVGAFERAMNQLRERRFCEFLRDYVLKRGRPLIGICLGRQLRADGSDEHGQFAVQFSLGSRANQN